MLQPPQILDANASNNGTENAFQISDEDLDECENLDDDCMLDDGSEIPSTINGGRGPYERAWTTEATRALIHIRGPMEGSFTEGRQKRTALWLYCTRQLQRMGFRYSAAKVQKKWHNILITYNKNLGKKYQSGYVHWEFFEEMFKYLQGKKADFEIQQQQQQQLKEEQEIQKQQQQQIQQQIVQVEGSLNNNVEPYIGHVDQKLLQPHVQLDTKSNDEFDEDSNTMSELRQPKLEYDAEQLSQLLDQHTRSGYGEPLAQNNSMAMGPDGSPDSIWWKDYFERKLQMDREKIDLQRNIHRDNMQYNKMSMVQHERMERLKIEAINSLTATLQKLVDVKSRKSI